MEILVISSPSEERKKNVEVQFASQTDKHSYRCMPATMHAQASVGIMRSFKSCITAAIWKNLPEIMIMEDDFKCLSPDSITRFIKIWESTWLRDGIFLAGAYEGSLPNIPNMVGFDKITGKISGLQAIIVPNRFYKTILDAQEPYNLDYWLSVEAKVPFFCANPMLIIQNDGYSYNAKSETQYNQALHLKYNLINHDRKNDND